MHANMDFGDDFEDLKRGMKDFGEFMRNLVSDSTCCSGPWSRHWGPEACSGHSSFFYPRTNIFSTANGDLVFEFQLPGFNESDLSIGFSGDMLILTAKAPVSKENEETRFERRNFTRRDIERREYDVPARRYDQSRAKAVFKNGILTVTIPSKGGTDDSAGIKINIETD